MFFVTQKYKAMTQQFAHTEIRANQTFLSCLLSRTFVVLNVSLMLLDPGECFSTPFTNETFLVAMFMLMCTHVTWVKVLICALITFEFCRMMIKQMGIQFQFMLESFTTTRFETHPVSYNLVYPPMFSQLTLELEPFATGVALYHRFIMRVPVFQHTCRTCKGMVTVVTFHRGDVFL